MNCRNVGARNGGTTTSAMLFCARPMKWIDSATCAFLTYTSQAHLARMAGAGSRLVASTGDGSIRSPSGFSAQSHHMWQRSVICACLVDRQPLDVKLPAPRTILRIHMPKYLLPRIVIRPAPVRLVQHHACSVPSERCHQSWSVGRRKARHTAHGTWRKAQGARHPAREYCRPAITSVRSSHHALRTNSRRCLL